MDVLERVTPIIRHAAHPLRLRILDFLHVEGPERTVSDIIEACAAPQSLVSQHLRILKDQGVLACRREGTNILYRVANENVLLLLECIRRHGACERSLVSSSEDNLASTDATHIRENGTR
jgi:ArsR family transcriptional regulator